MTPQSMTLKLPMPPSTNNLFVNTKGVGRTISKQYREWREAAAGALWEQRKQFFDGQVKITIVISDRGRASDLDNRAKACIDFTVKHGFIKSDSRETVRAIDLRWGDIPGCEVTVEAYAAFPIITRSIS